jgi:pimeloyl-ACP methyl ester carboxylesterase
MHSSKIIYFISGLGADKKIFENIVIHGAELFYMEWIKPLANESIQSYAVRMAAQIKHPNPILVGLSFGGMLAIEIAKFTNTEKVILISSAKTFKQIPFYMRFLGWLKLDKILPKSWYFKYNKLIHWAMGPENKEEENLLQQYVQNSDPDYIQWAIGQIVHWENDFIPPNTVHIHGTNDKVLPFVFADSDFTIENGGHFMTHNKANELSRLIEKII